MTSGRPTTGPYRLMAGCVRLWETVLAAILAAIMLLTFVDVIGRYALNAPLRGAYEITELAMGVLVLGALPMVSARREHIRVDLADALMTGRAGPLRDILVALATCAISGLVAWQLWHRAGQALREGDATFLLALPTAPFTFAMAVFVTLNTLVLAVHLILAGRAAAMPEAR